MNVKVPLEYLPTQIQDDSSSTKRYFSIQYSGILIVKVWSVPIGTIFFLFGIEIMKGSIYICSSQFSDKIVKNLFFFSLKCLYNFILMYYLMQVFE